MQPRSEAAARPAAGDAVVAGVFARPSSSSPWVGSCCGCTSGSSRAEKRSVRRTLPPDYRFDRPTRSEIMPTSQAAATWEGKLKDGKGSFKAGSGAFSGPYSFATRFEGKKGTNPEELIAAAHAACFSMALAAGLEKGGQAAQPVHPDAVCQPEEAGGNPSSTRLQLKVRGKVPGLDQAAFQRAAEEAKTGCPVSRALKGIPQVTLDATLE